MTQGERWTARVRAGVPTVLVVGLLGAALVHGLDVRIAAPAEDEGLSVFSVAPPPPPPVRVVPERIPSQRAAGRASPRNLRSKATEVAAPVPIIVLPVIPPIVTAPVPRAGNDPTAGASDRPGPGTGAGGLGDGDGAGGDGDGDGDGYALETPPRRIAGRIRDSDYPEAAADAGAGGTVSVRYYVETNGRATHCSVTRSSGNAELDDVTCRLIEKRFRYDPSRDADGRPVRSIIVVDHDWQFEREPAQPSDRR
ncbi:energy transducer TonB [uncultured Sphingomonas sp.]|uniref:energy transducer TonB n=1 Tax=uncultured Sphingomonas sp. TaxID=158754 RepID=UPI00260876C3|nr:TonB family protein [uncultured Sphingomonas sp.]